MFHGVIIAPAADSLHTYLRRKILIRNCKQKQKFMITSKPYILSIAGFDPSGGAGILADIKTIEANGGYGLGALSAITYQNDISFEKVEWLPVDTIVNQIKVLQKRFPVQYIKIGLIENMEVLYQLVTHIKEQTPDAVIVWDPVLKASAGFVFHPSFEKEMLQQVLKNIFCITPNIPEAKQLFQAQDLTTRLVEESKRCSVYLKGGHNDGLVSTDILFIQQQAYPYKNRRLPAGEKHGSGCVLSAALTTQLAVRNDIVMAAKEANQYTFQFLASNETLLGYHQYNFL